MKWKKLGLVFDLTTHKPGWLKSHAMTPTPLELEDKIRVYYTGRDQNGQSRISFVDLDKKDPSKVIYVHDAPVMDIGKIGMFDDCGTICTCAVEDNGRILLYYTAYSVSYKVPYKNAIGVGISTDGGLSFTRAFDGPIVDRSKEEPYFVISPWVLKHHDEWHMWYASATDWILVNDKPESIYHIKYASSKDGLEWKHNNASCIHPIKPTEANARPAVILDGEQLKMWFTFRGSFDFRDGEDSYRIGYAEAGIQSPTTWQRIETSPASSLEVDPYDETMQAYPSIIRINGKLLMFYNGNGFGVNGFCVAIES
ncbi:MAG: hypothetical protein RLP15_06415 [Cryomorphaceae bacterium]